MLLRGSEMIHQPIPKTEAASLPETQARVLRSLDGLEVPACLQDNMDRHCKHLVELVDMLGKAGIDEAGIEASVSQIIESYRQALILNLKDLHRNAVDD